MKLKNVVKILGLAFVAVFSGASALCSVKETKSADAANIPTSTVLYLTPNTNWNVDNARFAAYFFSNSGNAWASMTKVENETNLYSVITPSGSWGNVIFCRMNPSAAANNWTNKWNQTADLTWDGTNNHYTVKENTWDKGGGTWSVYTPAVALEEFDVTYHDKDGAVVETETVKEGATFTPKLLKEDGMRLEGWYLEETFTTKISKGDLITADIDVYPNYVEANDYWIYIYDENAVLGNITVHIFGNELGAPAPAAWPGVAAENLKHNFWRFKVEADQGYDAIVVTNGAASGTKQTVDLSLSHESEIFVIGALSEGKYTAMTQGITAANLAVYVMAGSEEGQCNVQFAPARDFYLSMSASEQELFQTSEDATIAAARERYEAWATALGQKAYEAGSLSRGSLLTTSNSNSLILVAVIASVIGVGALFAIKALKRKKEN
jgi:hypothetical protein